MVIAISLLGCFVLHAWRSRDRLASWGFSCPEFLQVGPTFVLMVGVHLLSPLVFPTPASELASVSRLRYVLLCRFRFGSNWYGY